MIELYKIITIILCLNSCDSLKITSIDNDIMFTDIRPTNTSICIPAAYTNKDGSIQGEYIIDGVIYGTPSRKEKVSIHPTKGLIISSNWQSDNGFQQHVLVKNSKARQFKDSRKRFRRALCSDNSNNLMIIESTHKLTLIEFAELLSKHCKHAVNLDMGCYGYGWYNNHTCSAWAIYNKHKQTNWITL